MPSALPTRTCLYCWLLPLTNEGNVLFLTVKETVHNGFSENGTAHNQRLGFPLLTKNRPGRVNSISGGIVPV